MKTKSKKDCRPTCCECGGTNVETTSWIEYREDGTERTANSEGPLSGEEGNWCHDCDAHVDLDYPKTSPSQDRDRQLNNAARERGPELLDAVIELLPLAHQRLLDRFKVSMCGEDTGATLESDGLPVGWKQAADYRKARELVDALVRSRPE
jgi:hypothetical protein